MDREACYRELGTALYRLRAEQYAEALGALTPYWRAINRDPALREALEDFVAVYEAAADGDDGAEELLAELAGTLHTLVELAQDELVARRAP